MHHDKQQTQNLLTNRIFLVILLVIAVVSIALLLTSCGEAEKSSFQQVESSRGIAASNAEFNAKAWRAKNPIYSEWGLITDGDSTISSTCVQGDGWATMKLVDPKNNAHLVKLKCSTFSASIGCLLASDFQTKSYASQDGNCNDEAPKPLPKIVK